MRSDDTPIHTAVAAFPDSHRNLILRVACTLGATFTKEDLVVACWQKHPQQFGLTASDGVSRPHTNSVFPKMGQLVARGHLDWESAGVLSVTARGRSHGRDPEEVKAVKRGKMKTPAAGARKQRSAGERSCAWCSKPATHVDPDGDDACADCKSEAAAKKARTYWRMVAAGAKPV